jgi:hypothetical protein
MITLTREVMQMALDAFETHAKQYPHMVKGYTVDAAQALRAALAQPEPEPVAFVVYDSESNDIVWTEAGMHLKQNTPLYTVLQQREWVGLTDDEHMKLAEEWGCLSADWVLYAAAVERKLKDKNNGL